MGHTSENMGPDLKRGPWSSVTPSRTRRTSILHVVCALYIQNMEQILKKALYLISMYFSEMSPYVFSLWTKDVTFELS